MKTPVTLGRLSWRLRRSATPSVLRRACPRASWAWRQSAHFCRTDAELKEEVQKCSRMPQCVPIMVMFWDTCNIAHRPAEP